MLPGHAGVPPIGSARCGRLGLVAEDGAGHGDVERLRRAGHRDGDPTRRRRGHRRRRARGPRCPAPAPPGRAGRARSATPRRVPPPRPSARPHRPGRSAPEGGRRRWRSGTRKMAPADARTHLGFQGSTDAPVSTAALAPNASAVRSSVPALPGSPTSTSTRHRNPVAAAATASASAASARSRWWPPPGGDGVDRAGEDVVATRRTTAPAASARASSAGSTDASARTSCTTTPGGQRLVEQGRAVDDHRTLLQTRAAAPREAPQSLDTRMPGADRLPDVVQARSSAKASVAASTRAVNAAGSWTARSASTLRSTSISARRSPAMNRL